MPKVAFCVPSLDGVTAPFREALVASIPLIEAAGWDHGAVQEIGCPYISSARATMLRKALDADADTIVFLDYDLSWAPGDLLRLIEADGEVVAGLYRFKTSEEEYMGTIRTMADHRPVVRADGCMSAERVPAGYLKITRDAVRRFMRAYPELVFGDPIRPSVDLFNHGAHAGQWWGEDYAFSRRWVDAGGEIWVVPDLSLTHHAKVEAYPGNYHMFMRRQPGGDLHQAA